MTAQHYLFLRSFDLFKHLFSVFSFNFLVKVHTARKLGDGAVSAAPPPLRPTLLKPLLDLYGRDIAKLERLTGRDLSAWRELRSTTRHTGQRTTSDGGATQAADAEG